MSLDTDFNVWQRRAAQLVQPKIEGNSALSHDQYFIRLWTPAPPKMYVHPRRIKERLFAQYTSVHTKELDDNDEDENLTLTGEHGTIFTNFSEQDSLIEPSFLVPVIKPYKSLERLPSTIDHSDEFQMIPTMIRSSRSCSNLTTETVIRFDTDYAFTLDETKHQIDARKTVKIEPKPPTPIPIVESQIIPSESAEIIDVKENSLEPTVEEKSREFKYFPKTNRSKLYEKAVTAGRPHISSGRLRAARRSRKDVRFWERIDAIVAIATAPPRSSPLSRRHSFHEAFFYEQHHPHIIKQQFRERRISLERDKQNFDEIVKPKYKYDETRVKSGGKRLLNEFEWTRELWYSWLDEYIAELDKQEVIRQEKEEKRRSTMLTPFDETLSTTLDSDENEDNSIRKVTTVQVEPITNLHLADSEERRLIENEIHRLTSIINRNPRDVFSLTRRGGLLRKLGLFHDALNDLSLAIYIEPLFMDAYWQRALIYIIFEHYDEALDSLNMCIKFNKTHAGAYKLRGDVYRIKNDLALAIANYSQAIRYNPTDHEAYFQRAQTYERRNEILLAMDDYIQVTRLNPKKIEAW
jgi:tetratricopeptide (TPR) repeat protein